MAILGDFEEFEGPVPEPPYPYHHENIASITFITLGITRVPASIMTRPRVRKRG